VPCIVWLRTPDEIIVASTSHNEQFALPYRDQISFALARGFTLDQIWEYHGMSEGNQYLTARTKPYKLAAKDATEALSLALSRLIDQNDGGR
jgi:hypothetical protein